MLDELITGRDAAGPFISPRIQTKLISFWRIDTREADFCVADLDGIAVYDTR
jgi:hypothetical protein